MSHRHEPGPLKQQNKAHKTRFRSKSQRLDRIVGRTEIANVSKKKKAAASKAARRHHLAQARANKREASFQAKRRVGIGSAPPHLILIVHLQDDMNAAFRFCDALMDAAAPRSQTSTAISIDESPMTWYPSNNSTTIFSTKFKYKITFSVAPLNLQGALEMAKVADTVVFLGAPFLDASSATQLFVNCLCAQGVPTTVHVLDGLASLSQKKRIEAKKTFSNRAADVLPETSVHYIEKDSDHQTCLWSIINKKRRKVHWRESRSHILADCVSHRNGELFVTGYVRGPSFNVHGIVYLPGLGGRKISRVLHAIEPTSANYPRSSTALVQATSEDLRVTVKPSEFFQHDLQTEAVVDHLDAEQTFPTEEELEEANIALEHAKHVKTTKVRVPKGFSDYQASWMMYDADGQDGDDIHTGDEDSDSEQQMVTSNDDAIDQIWKSVKNLDFVVEDNHSICSSAQMNESANTNEIEEEEDDDDDGLEEREYEINPQMRAMQYDAAMDMTEEQSELKKLRAAREDLEFPDEVDTPMDIPARMRFAKYRGLQSFRTTPWDPKEDLPPQYARIFTFRDIIRTWRTVLKEIKVQQRDEEMQTYFIPEGSYVTICVQDVAEDYLETIDTNMPFILWSLLFHENRMSVMHYVLKMHPTYQEPIKSKERLVFHTGTRQFSAEPIFSSHSSGNKHKFERFMQPGSVCVASVIAPIDFPPMPVLCYKKQDDGSLLLVATGSAIHASPNRIIVKRIRLSGHPFKINKRSAVVRYMFFNPDDIYWFKPVELVTKFGRRGHIKDSLGTHGHMKCVFDKQLKAHDTVLMNLYKRVYPKWNFAVERAAALPTITLGPIQTTNVQEETNNDMEQ